MELAYPTGDALENVAQVSAAIWETNALYVGDRVTATKIGLGFLENKLQGHRGVSVL